MIIIFKMNFQIHLVFTLSPQRKKTATQKAVLNTEEIAV